MQHIKKIGQYRQSLAGSFTRSVVGRTLHPLLYGAETAAATAGLHPYDRNRGDGNSTQDPWQAISADDSLPDPDLMSDGDGVIVTLNGSAVPESGTSSSNESRENAYEDEEEAVIPFISEIVLCCEAEEGKVPQSLEVLYQAAQCNNTSDCLLLAAHLLMLETGFLPKGCEGQDREMPSGWRVAGGLYRLQYIHPLCENSLVQVAAMPMGQTFALNASLKMASTAERSWTLVLKPDAYVTNKWAGGNAGGAYRDLKKLSCIFKDQLAYPLIATAREALGLPALFGLTALPPELLLVIMRLLDVSSLLKLSAVCRHLHSTANDASLWKHVLYRDFRVTSQGDNEHRDRDWKELYKKKYRQRKTVKNCRLRCYTFQFSSFRPPAPVFIPPIPLSLIRRDYDHRLNIPQGIPTLSQYEPFDLLTHNEPDIRFPFLGHLLRRGVRRSAAVRRRFN